MDLEAWTLVIPIGIAIVGFWFLRKVVKLGVYLGLALLLVAGWWFFFVR